MIAATLPNVAALSQALMAAEPPPADPQPTAAGAADFAMMMAGLGAPPPAPVPDGTADVGQADDDMRAKDKGGRDGDDTQPQDAALLAMLALTPQAPPQDARAPEAAADVQASATISAAARAATAGTVPDRSASACDAPGPASGATDTNDAKPAVTKAVAAAALKLKQLSADPDAAAGMATAPDAVAATIDAVRDPKRAKVTDAAADFAPPASSPPAQAADTAAISVLAQVLAGDHPRATHAAATSRDTLGAELGEQRLSLVQGSGWLDQLARDIASTAGLEGKLHFRLNPEHLGSLHVEVTRGADGAAVRMTADTQTARDILVDAQPQLAAEARAQGVRLAGTHVDLGGAGGQSASGNGRPAAQDSTPQVRAIGASAATTDTTEPRGAAPERYA